MKKIIIIIFFLVMILNANTIYATDTEEMIAEQEEILGISSFIKQSQKYTQDAFEDIDINNLYKNALTGNIDTKGMLNGILKILGSEVTKTVTSLGLILIIVIIHSIIKSISEGMGNNEIGEITYYVQYILIVTLIMTNFSETVVLIKDTINNLVRIYKLLITYFISINDDNTVT